MNRLFQAFSRLWAMLLVALTSIGPTHIQGTYGTETGNQDRRQLTWRDTIQYLDPDCTMFTQLLMRLPNKKVKSTEFKLFEKEHRSKWTRANEAMDASETGFDVDDGSMFKAEDILLVDSERMLVSSVSGNTLTVTRGILGSTAATHDDDAWILLLFERQKEGGLSGTPIATDFSTVTNFTQIFKVPYGISRSKKMEDVRGTSDIEILRTEALVDYKRQVEHAILWGKKRLETGSGTVRRYTGGLDEFITTNRLDAEGGLGFGDIGWIVNQTTRFGGSKKLWFCGRDARQQLDALGLEYMRIGPKDNILGMAVDGVRTSFGEFMLITHHGLENAHAGRIYIVDPAHIAWAGFMAMKHEQNIQANDLDGELHQFIGEGGVWLDTEKAHAVILNVSDGTL